MKQNRLLVAKRVRGIWSVFVGKYRIYIDEVGNPDLDSSDNPNHRFLSLTGVIIDLEHVNSVIHPQMESLNTKYFGSHPDEPVVFHRKELVNKKPPFTGLADETVCSRFDEELLAYLRNWNYRVISVCIDKKQHKEQYSVWRHDPYHYCLAILLERYVMYLGRITAHGDVMAESRGGKEDMRLKESFRRLVEQGTDFMDAAQFQSRLTSIQLKIKTKQNNIAGLQLADLIAHPSRAEMLLEKGFSEKPLAPFGRQVVEILREKYDQQSGRMYGKKMLP